ncbi:unnamed protein product [Cochlearia groenlandica]
MGNIELQSLMAMRDQIIYHQREAQRNQWNSLTGLGITIEELSMASYSVLPYKKQISSFVPSKIPFVEYLYSEALTFQRFCFGRGLFMRN